jgi:hypothetical protein
MRAPTKRRQRESGSALIEFLLSSLVWVPLLLGTIFIGLNIVRTIQVTQICRSAGHMHAFGVDFSQLPNQQLLVRLANGFPFTPTGGNGVVILSTITFITKADCDAAGRTKCANIDQAVLTRRVVVGNRQLRSSAFGTPNPGSIDSGGNISSNAYLDDPTARAGNFTTLLPMKAGQFAYLSEAYFTSPDLDWPGFTSGSASASRAIF